LRVREPSLDTQESGPPRSGGALTRKFYELTKEIGTDGLDRCVPLDMKQAWSQDYSIPDNAPISFSYPFHPVVHATFWTQAAESESAPSWRIHAWYDSTRRKMCGESLFPTPGAEFGRLIAHIQFIGCPHPALRPSMRNPGALICAHHVMLEWGAPAQGPPPVSTQYWEA
jgi:hypothetical protein